MNDKELTGLLKGMLVAVNREARLVPPKLEAEMCLALDRVGGNWVLAGLQAQGISGVQEAAQASDIYWKVMKTEEGRRLVKSTIEANKIAIKEVRRKVVSLIGAFAQGHCVLTLKVDPLLGNGGVYEMLLRQQKAEEGKDEESIHHN